MPGGFGTLDEIFETLTLMQTGKIEAFPLVCMGTDFWHEMRDFLDQTLVTEKTIAPEDVGLIHYSDDCDEVARYISQHPRGCANNRVTPG